MKRRKMRGGIHFGTFLGTPGTIGPDVFPIRLWVALRQGFGEEGQPLVEPGDRVLAGQIVGRDDAAISTPVHAPRSGKVEAIGPLGEGESEERFIVIAADGKDDRAERTPIGPDFERLSPQDVGRALYECGVTALGRAGIPTPFQSSPAGPDAVDTLIVPLVETPPLAPGAELRINGHWKELAAGIRVLKHALAVERVIIAFASERVRTQFVPWLNQLSGAELRQVSERYPQDSDEMLVETLTDRRVPDDGLSTEVGVVCARISAVLAAHAAVQFGQPVLRQEIAVAGTGLAQPEIVRAPIGTLLSEFVDPRRASELEVRPHEVRTDAVRSHEVRIVLGDPLTGKGVPEGGAPVYRGLEQVSVLPEKREPELLAFLRPGKERHSYSSAFLASWVPGSHFGNHTGMNGERRVCICCNYCDEACPRDLMPHQLSKLVGIEEIEEARRIRLTACIECGLCSYVCPSKIPLLDDIRRGKKLLAEELAHEQTAS